MKSDPKRFSMAASSASVPLSRKTVRRASAEKLPFDDRVFDAIFAFHLLRHLVRRDLRRRLEQLLAGLERAVHQRSVANAVTSDK